MCWNSANLSLFNDELSRLVAECLFLMPALSAGGNRPYLDDKKMKDGIGNE